MIIYRLQLTFRAIDRVEFAPQAGAQLRGALYDALRHQSCPAPSGHHHPQQAELCPVCWLMAREDPTAARGKDIPRAFTLQPPPDTTCGYVPGEAFSFGLTLFGKAIALFPYIVLALPFMGRQGVGYGRGRFRLNSIESIHPLSGQRELLTSADIRTVRQPTLSVNAEQIKAQATTLPIDRLTLRFLTPTRLTENGKLVKTPIFPTIMARLLERLDVLNNEYGDYHLPSPWEYLTALASRVQFDRDSTHWLELRSGSRRSGTVTPISGFIGEASYSGHLSPFREWLLWGQCIQIGKDTVKGNGLFEVVKGG